MSEKCVMTQTNVKHMVSIRVVFGQVQQQST